MVYILVFGFYLEKWASSKKVSRFNSSNSPKTLLGTDLFFNISQDIKEFFL